MSAEEDGWITDQCVLDVFRAFGFPPGSFVRIRDPEKSLLSLGLLGAEPEFEVVAPDAPHNPPLPGVDAVFAHHVQHPRKNLPAVWIDKRTVIAWKPRSPGTSS